MNGSPMCKGPNTVTWTTNTKSSECQGSFTLDPVCCRTVLRGATYGAGFGVKDPLFNDIVR